ncbi:MAG: hypothetical protein O7B99_01090 [Planctomycetota bacterium]|nr:hypothetical protein [Planctomycetota bacterium]
MVVLALLPTVGRLGAPPISDDAAALGYVHRSGFLGDWVAPQYGLELVRFWRPLATTTLGLQEALTGTAAAPLRALNLVAHVAAALLVGLLARRLGAGALGALAAGGLAACTPEQGGTVIWLVGRVDSLSVALVLLAAWLALGGRRVAALAAAFLACATKEVAFVLAPWTWLFALGRGDSMRAALRPALPLLAASAAALVWRRLALGEWVGGYPGGEPGLPSGLWLAAVALGRTQGLFLAGLLGLALAAAAFRALDARMLLAGAGCACLAAAPLYGLLSDGQIEEQNLRTLLFFDLTLCLAAGASLRPARPRVLVLPLVVVAVVAGWRLRLANEDAAEWTAAAVLAEEHVRRTRDTLADVEPSEHPVFDATLPRTHGGAYCLAWGAADRFRAPFPATPRPVWPWRTIFDRTESKRAPAMVPRDQLLWPFGGSRSTVPPILVTIEGADGIDPVPVDERVALEPDTSPVLEIWGTFSFARRIEFLVFTEIGYEPGIWRGGDLEGESARNPRGGADRVRRISLRRILLQAEAQTLGEALRQAADVGATHAYLQVRAVDDARGELNRPIAASRFIRLEWEPTLLGWFERRR